MAIVSDFYGTLQEAQDYFDNRLHEKAWSRARPLDRPKALRAATIIIDTLAYKGIKASVSVYMNSIPRQLWTDADIRAADATQPLEFPRGIAPTGRGTSELGVIDSVIPVAPPDAVVPEAIRIACYEIAH